jgi:HK97 gp10 family phage protein
MGMVQLRFEGGAALQKQLAELPKRLSQKVQAEALLAAGAPMRTRIAELAPVDPEASEHLKDHIVLAKLRRTSAEVAEGATSVGIGVPRRFFYDWFREFGTRFQPAHGFYRPAFDEGAERAIKLVGMETWAALAKAGFGTRASSSGGGLL